MAPQSMLYAGSAILVMWGTAFGARSSSAER